MRTTAPITPRRGGFGNFIIMGVVKLDGCLGRKKATADYPPLLEISCRNSFVWKTYL